MASRPFKGNRLRPFGELAETLLSPLTERQTGMTLDLIAAWEHLAGPDHARRTRPERLKWPRTSADEFAPATLVVACDGAHAVFFQHETKGLIERLNRFFGFAAVERVQIVQKPVEGVEDKWERPVPDRATLRRVEKRLDHIKDQGLRAALTRLGAAIENEKN